MLGSTLPARYSSMNLPMFFSLRSFALPCSVYGYFWFLEMSWMAKAGHLPTSRFRLPPCWPKALASMVAKLSLPFCFSAMGLRAEAREARSSAVSEKM